MAWCNCENSKCKGHGDGTMDGFKVCPNPAGEKKLLYVGKVCDTCFNNMPAEYRKEK